MNARCRFNASRWLLASATFFLAAVPAMPSDRLSINEALERRDLRGVRKAIHDDPASVNAGEEDGYTPLLIAATFSGDEFVALLLAKGARPDVFAAAAMGDADLLEKLLKGDPALAKAINRFGETPLHYAAQQNQRATARLLLDRGADVNAHATGRHRAIDTPLYRAVGYSDAGKEMAELLLARGADPFVKDDNNATLLHEAAASGKPAVIKLLLARKLDINAADKYDDTPLYSAAFSGSLSGIETLLDAGARINDRDGLLSSALNVALAMNHMEAAELLRRRGAKLGLYAAVRMGRAKESADSIRRVKEKPEAERDWPLDDAVLGGNTEIVRMMLDAGAKLDAEMFTDTGATGYTILDDAAGRGLVDVTKLLLDRGAKVDAVSRDGWTPLAVAALNGHADVVRLLLRRGADVEGHGEAPINKAVGNGHKEVVKILMAELNAKMRAVDLDDLLGVAVRNRQKGVAEYLISLGARVGPKFAGERTLLHAAASGADRAVVALLLDRGAAVNAITNDYQTPLHEVARRSSGTTEDAVAVSTMLLDHGAAVNGADKDGDTALHLAAKYADMPLVRLLLDRRADAKAKNKAGQLPWQLADAEGQDEIADLLRKAAEK